jgi:hypothetical protein
MDYLDMLKVVYGLSTTSLLQEAVEAAEEVSATSIEASVSKSEEEED